MQGCQFDIFEAKFWNSGFFWRTWLFLKIKITSQNLAFLFHFFSLKGLIQAKHCLSLQIFSESMTMQGAKNIAKIWLLPLKFLVHLIRNNCMTGYLWGKKMLLKNGIACYRCFWWVLIYVYVLFAYACFMCSLCVLGLPSGLFCFFSRQGLAFLVNLITCRRLAMTTESC